MGWIKVKAFNQSEAGKRRGYCLQNVRLGFNIDSKYPTAWKAWQNTRQHAGAPPTGVDVPVFFTYKTDGHVGVRLANGKFWSDGNIYTSISAYEKTHTPRYVGWGESLDGERIVRYVAPPKSVTYKPGMHVVGKTAFLSKSVSSWAIYPLNKPPKHQNAMAHLNPKKFGGLSYKLLAGTKWANTFTIQTEDFGKVNIYLDSDATIK